MGTTDTVTMTLADQAAMTGHDGHVTGNRPGRPARRTFTAAYKARILAAFDALPGHVPRDGRGWLPGRRVGGRGFHGPRVAPFLVAVMVPAGQPDGRAAGG
jgi:hypothetical protein